MGRKPIGAVAMTGAERQRRRMAQLKAASNNAPIVDIPAITRWWKAATANQRELLCTGIGGYELVCAMFENDEFHECIDFYVDLEKAAP